MYCLPDSAQDVAYQPPEADSYIKEDMDSDCDNSDNETQSRYDDDEEDDGDDSSVAGWFNFICIFISNCTWLYMDDIQLRHCKRCKNAT